MLPESMKTEEDTYDLIHIVLWQVTTQRSDKIEIKITHVYPVGGQINTHWSIISFLIHMHHLPSEAS